MFEELIKEEDFILSISIFKKHKSYNNNKTMILEEKKNNIEKSDTQKLIEKEIQKQMLINELSNSQEVINDNNRLKDDDDNLNEFVNNLRINFQNISFTNILKIYEFSDKNDLVKRINPSWSNEIVINNLKIYNMCVLDNIMSYNNNTEIDALDYFGFKIKYNELPNYFENYMKVFLELGITLNDIITICLPNTIENILLILALNKSK